MTVRTGRDPTPLALSAHSSSGSRARRAGDRRPPKSFGVKGGTVEAVKGISLRVAKGEVLGCLGSNGAGKTTSLRMLTTLLPPSATSVSRAAPTGTPPAARSSSSTACIGQAPGRGGCDGTHRPAATGRVRRPPGADVLRRPAAAIERWLVGTLQAIPIVERELVVGVAVSLPATTWFLG